MTPTTPPLTPAADLDLPELPSHRYCLNSEPVREGYTAAQMFEYARDAIAASRRAASGWNTLADAKMPEFAKNLPCTACGKLVRDHSAEDWPECIRSTQPSTSSLPDVAMPEKKPVARLQSYISNRPFSEGKEFFDVIILDRDRAADGLELFAAPVMQHEALHKDALNKLIASNAAQPAEGSALSAEVMTLLRDAARAWNNEKESDLDAAMERIECFLIDSRGSKDAEGSAQVTPGDKSAPKDMWQACEWITQLRARVDSLLAIINAPSAAPERSDTPAEPDDIDRDAFWILISKLKQANAGADYNEKREALLSHLRAWCSRRVSAASKALDAAAPADLTNAAYEQAASLCDRFGVREMHPAECAGAIRMMKSKGMSAGLTDAASDVLAERRRQVEQEGWAPEHDDKYSNCELARAAATYAVCSHIEQLKLCGEQLWPWHPDWWKRGSYRRDLVKAGALIVAEIERLDRATSQPIPTGNGDTDKGEGA